MCVVSFVGIKTLFQDETTMKIANQQPEDTLILLCLEYFIGADNGSTITPVLEMDLDWQRIVSLSIRHRVLPLLHRVLIPNFSQYISQSVQSYLENYLTDLVKRNLLLSGNLLKIITLFEKNTICAIPFKGPVLAETLYGGLALRQFCDLDILVAKHDAIRARNLLIGYGFQTDFALSNDKESLYLEHENFFSLTNPISGINIDLHWELSGRYNLEPITLEMLLADSITVQFSGRNLMAMSAEKELVYICIHASSHCWEQLEFITAVAAFLADGKNLQWQKLIDWAETMHCRRMLLLGLSIADTLFQVPIPDTIRFLIRQDSGVKQMSGTIRNSLFKEDHTTLPWRFSLMHIINRDNFIDKIRYAIRIGFRPTIAEWQGYKLPRYLTFLYPLLRPLRLGLKWFLGGNGGSTKH